MRQASNCSICWRVFHVLVLTGLALSVLPLSCAQVDGEPVEPRLTNFEARKEQCWPLIGSFEVYAGCIRGAAELYKQCLIDAAIGEAGGELVVGLLNGGFGPLTSAPLGAPASFVFEIPLSGGSEGTYRVELWNGVADGPGKDPNALMRVAGNIQVNGVAVLAEGDFNAAHAFNSFEVELVAGVNQMALTFSVDDDSEFGFVNLVYVQAE